MSLYCIKMRASVLKNDENIHISGAEKIINMEYIAKCSQNLINRALFHANGKPDFINLKIEEISNEKIKKLKSLPITTISVKSPKEGVKKVDELLKNIGIKNSKKILDKFKETYQMRGAMLLDINTLQRLEPDFKRGLRATYMDNSKIEFNPTKNHFHEALVLATKVANAPNIVGEICISDDKDYQIGYFASKKTGYVRITKLKEKGYEFGGRIFLYDGDIKDVNKTIEYLEKQCVIVEECNDLEKHSKWNFIEDELENLKNKKLYRNLLEVESPINTRVICNSKELLMFASNNYLNLANDEEIKEFVTQIIKNYGTGSGASRLICGNFKLNNQLEKALASFKNTEASLVFNSGYVANLTILSTLFDENDVIFSDELNHASIIDGCHLSKAHTIIYKHNDMQDLENKIKSVSFKKAVIVSDAVFSMDGDIVNLPELLKLAQKYNLFSMVDEAHSTGVIGKVGKGIVEYFNIKDTPDILMGTLSKAIGAEGGFVCGKKILIEYLKNKARGFIFSTALSPVTIASAIKGLDIIQKQPQRILKLQENIKYFNKILKEFNIKAQSETAIFPIIIGNEAKTLKISEQLFDKGYFISAIRYPTVEKGQARLRITLNANHKKSDLKNLVKDLSIILKETK